MTATSYGPTVRRIALVAHDNCKQDMLEWAAYNRGTLARHELIATATTGRLLADELGLPVTRLLSGPFGGDQQIGARIAEGLVDLLIFMWDPLAQHPHDPDVKALLRVAVVWNVPVACNRASADFLVSSPLLNPSEPAEPVDPSEPSEPAGPAEQVAAA
ncbi:MAG TPA: methylglyoxal synthase [Streptosporangiaceae bacterium]|nr:methylglyoxal synthase [Streptosporangiaceae bacterium]